MWFTRGSFVKIGEKQGRRHWRARAKNLWHWYKIIPSKIRRRMKNCAGTNIRIRDVSTNNIDCCIPSKGKIFCWRAVGDIMSLFTENVCVYSDIRKTVCVSFFGFCDTQTVCRQSRFPRCYVAGMLRRQPSGMFQFRRVSDFRTVEYLQTTLNLLRSKKTK